MLRFNPLHCGAMVASGPPSGRNESVLVVSIPFIAGQWSLPSKPLFPPENDMVSIPFIAGQWSLLGQYVGQSERNLDVSIPFIAGQWSLQMYRCEVTHATHSGFNPLHCGAVVASRWAGAPCAPSRTWFQSPSLRGSGRFRHHPRLPGAGAGRVSIPFIAGQWSLLGGTTMRKALIFCFNPLHCGAVVASVNFICLVACSLPVSIPFIAGQWSLPSPQGGGGKGGPVSIPFIAGQWSLPAH